MRAVALLVLAGCGRVGFAEVPGSDGGAGDGGGDAAQAACFVEPFDTLDPARWERAYGINSVAVEVVDGRLALTPTPMVNEYNGISPLMRLDMTNAMFEVELVQVTSSPNTETSLEVEVNQNDRYIIAVTEGRIDFIARATGTSAMVALDVAMHRYWRIHHDAQAALIRFWTSADRSLWAQRFSVAAPAMMLAWVYLYAGQYGPGNATPGTGMFDNLRLVTADCP